MSGGVCGQIARSRLSHSPALSLLFRIPPHKRISSSSSSSSFFVHIASREEKEEMGAITQEKCHTGITTTSLQPWKTTVR